MLRDWFSNEQWGGGALNPIPLLFCKCVLLFDKSSNNGLLFHRLNIFIVYPSELNVKKAKRLDGQANYLDFTFVVRNNSRIYTKLYDKRDDFNFHIVNFPFLSSNIPSGLSCGVYISQLIRYYDDFGYRHILLVDRLLSQGFKVNRLRNSFQKFYGKYPDLVAKYQKSIRDMMNDSFLFLIK